MSNQPHYKALFEAEKFETDRLNEYIKMKALTFAFGIGFGLLAILAMFVLWQELVTAKRLLKDANANHIMVWQMDESCYQQLSVSDTLHVTVKKEN
jgi:hypothetical protein